MSGPPRTPHPFRAAALAAALGVLGAGALTAQQPEAGDLRPPFGLSWDETPGRIEQMLTAAKATIAQRRLIGSRECWTVEGLVQPNLRRSLFYFSGGKLAEVELQYQNDAWVASQYEAFFAQVRGRIEQRYGPGRLIARTKAPEQDVMQTVIGYQWNPPGGVLQVFYYSAEAGPRAWRTVSLHYKRS